MVKKQPFLTLFIFKVCQIFFMQSSLPKLETMSFILGTKFTWDYPIFKKFEGTTCFLSFYLPSSYGTCWICSLKIKAKQSVSFLL